LISPSFHQTARRVEDWEQFFADKSRRRADKDLAERRRARRGQIISVIVIGGVITAAIIALAVR